MLAHESAERPVAMLRRQRHPLSRERGTCGVVLEPPGRLDCRGRFRHRSFVGAASCCWLAWLACRRRRGLDWLPILRAAWSTAIAAPSALASTLGSLRRILGRRAERRRVGLLAGAAVARFGLALGAATVALGALARLMKRAASSKPVEAEAVG